MPMRSCTVYLKGNYSPRRQDWDQGQVDALRSRASTIVLMDNDYGLNTREYPMTNVERIEWRD